MYDLIEGYLFAVLMACTLFGVMYCFFGLRIFRVQLAISGFILGAGIGFAIGNIALELDIGPSIFVGLLGAILGAYLAYRLYLVGVFLTCFSLTTIVVAFIVYMAADDFDLGMQVGLVIGLIVGVLAVIFNKPVIIIITSINGGALLAVAFAAINLDFIQELVASTPAILLVVMLVFSVWGACVQFRAEKQRAARAAAAANPQKLSTSMNYNSIYETAPTNAPAFATTPVTPPIAPPAPSAPNTFDFMPTPPAPVPQQTEAVHTCPTCGNVIEGAKKFCTKCGTKL